MAHTEALSHLLRTVLSNFDVECVLRAKTLQLSLTGKGQWHDPRNCDMFPVNRLRKPYRHWNDMEWKPENVVWFDTVWKTKRQGGSWVSLATSHFGKIDMKIEAGTSRWSAVISACTVAASLDHRTQYMDGAPATNDEETMNKLAESGPSITSSNRVKIKREINAHEKFYICSDVFTLTHKHTQTHTHTRAHFYTEMIWHWAALRADTITNRVAFTKEWIYTRSFYIQMFYTGILLHDFGRRARFALQECSKQM